MFYLSAIPAGLAMVVIALYLCNRSLNTKVDPTIIKEVAWVISPMLDHQPGMALRRPGEAWRRTVSLPAASGDGVLLA